MYKTATAKARPPFEGGAASARNPYTTKTAYSSTTASGRPQSAAAAVAPPTPTKGSTKSVLIAPPPPSSSAADSGDTLSPATAHLRKKLIRMQEKELATKITRTSSTDKGKTTDETNQQASSQSEQRQTADDDAERKHEEQPLERTVESPTAAERGDAGNNKLVATERSPKRSKKSVAKRLKRDEAQLALLFAEMGAKKDVSSDETNSPSNFSLSNADFLEKAPRSTGVQRERLEAALSDVLEAIENGEDDDDKNNNGITKSIPPAGVVNLWMFSKVLDRLDDIRLEAAEKRSEKLSESIEHKHRAVVETSPATTTAAPSHGNNGCGSDDASVHHHSPSPPKTSSLPRGKGNREGGRHHTVATGYYYHPIGRNTVVAGAPHSHSPSRTGVYNPPFNASIKTERSLVGEAHLFGGSSSPSPLLLREHQQQQHGSSSSAAANKSPANDVDSAHDENEGEEKTQREEKSTFDHEGLASTEAVDTDADNGNAFDEDANGEHNHGEEEATAADKQHANERSPSVRQRPNSSPAYTAPTARSPIPPSASAAAAATPRGTASSSHASRKRKDDGDPLAHVPTSELAFVALKGIEKIIEKRRERGSDDSNAMASTLNPTRPSSNRPSTGNANMRAHLAATYSGGGGGGGGNTSSNSYARIAAAPLPFPFGAPPSNYLIARQKDEGREEDSNRRGGNQNISSSEAQPDDGIDASCEPAISPLSFSTSASDRGHRSPSPPGASQKRRDGAKQYRGSRYYYQAVSEDEKKKKDANKSNKHHANSSSSAGSSDNHNHRPPLLRLRREARRIYKATNSDATELIGVETVEVPSRCANEKYNAYYPSLPNADADDDNNETTPPPEPLAALVSRYGGGHNNVTLAAVRLAQACLQSRRSQCIARVIELKRHEHKEKLRQQQTAAALAGRNQQRPSVFGALSTPRGSRIGSNSSNPSAFAQFLQRNSVSNNNNPNGSNTHNTPLWLTPHPPPPSLKMAMQLSTDALMAQAEAEARDTEAVRNATLSSTLTSGADGKKQQQTSNAKAEEEVAASAETNNKNQVAVRHSSATSSLPPGTVVGIGSPQYRTPASHLYHYYQWRSYAAPSQSAERQLKNPHHMSPAERRRREQLRKEAAATTIYTFLTQAVAMWRRAKRQALVEAALLEEEHMERTKDIQALARGKLSLVEKQEKINGIIRNFCACFIQKFVRSKIFAKNRVKKLQADVEAEIVRRMAFEVYERKVTLIQALFRQRVARAKMQKRQKLVERAMRKEAERLERLHYKGVLRRFGQIVVCKRFVELQRRRVAAYNDERHAAEERQAAIEDAAAVRIQCFVRRVAAKQNVIAKKALLDATLARAAALDSCAVVFQKYCLAGIASRAARRQQAALFALRATEAAAEFVADREAFGEDLGDDDAKNGANGKVFATGQQKERQAPRRAFSSSPDHSDGEASFSEETSSKGNGGDGGALFAIETAAIDEGGNAKYAAENVHNQATLGFSTSRRPAEKENSAEIDDEGKHHIGDDHNSDETEKHVTAAQEQQREVQRQAPHHAFSSPPDHSDGEASFSEETSSKRSGGGGGGGALFAIETAAIDEGGNAKYAAENVHNQTTLGFSTSRRQNDDACGDDHEHESQTPPAPQQQQQRTQRLPSTSSSSVKSDGTTSHSRAVEEMVSGFTRGVLDKVLAAYTTEVQSRRHSCSRHESQRSLETSLLSEAAARQHGARPSDIVAASVPTSDHHDLISGTSPQVASSTTVNSEAPHKPRGELNAAKPNAEPEKEVVAVSEGFKMVAAPQPEADLKVMVASDPPANKTENEETKTSNTTTATTSTSPRPSTTEYLKSFVRKMSAARPPTPIEEVEDDDEPTAKKVSGGTNRAAASIQNAPTSTAAEHIVSSTVDYLMSFSKKKAAPRPPTPIEEELEELNGNNNAGTGVISTATAAAARRAPQQLPPSPVTLSALPTTNDDEDEGTAVSEGHKHQQHPFLGVNVSSEFEASAETNRDGGGDSVSLLGDHSATHDDATDHHRAKGTAAAADSEKEIDLDDTETGDMLHDDDDEGASSPQDFGILVTAPTVVDFNKEGEARRGGGSKAAVEKLKRSASELERAKLKRLDEEKEGLAIETDRPRPQSSSSRRHVVAAAVEMPEELEEEL